MLHSTRGWQIRCFVVLAVGVSVFLGLCMHVLAASVSVTWDANLETDLAGYKLYIGTSPGTYTQTIDVGRLTTYSVPSLAEGQTYFFVVTAYDIFANESGYSQEVSTMVAAVTPPSTGEVVDDSGTTSGSGGGSRKKWWRWWRR